MIPDRNGVFKKLLQSGPGVSFWGISRRSHQILIEARSSEEQLYLELDQSDGYESDDSLSTGAMDINWFKACSRLGLY